MAGGQGSPEAVRRVFDVSGMRCASCVQALTRALEEVPGVVSASVSLATREAVVTSEQADSAVDALVAAGTRAGGFHLEERSDESALPIAAGGEIRERREAGRRAAAAVPLAALTMAASMGWIPGVAAEAKGLWALGFAVPVQFWCAAPFTRGLFRAVRHRLADMDTLVALGTWTAFLWSVGVLLSPQLGSGAVAGAGATWFDSAAMIVALVLMGRWMEARARHRSGDAVRALLALAPDEACVERDGEEHVIAASEVVVGDVCVLRPGDRIPVDGTVLDGHTAVDESMLTGESLAVEKGPGAPLAGGTLNRTGSVRMRAMRVGKDTALARIVRAVRAAQSSRAPVEALVDRVAAVFVPVVLAAAVLTGVVWLVVLWADGPAIAATTAMVRAVTVLIIACPCALGLATPTAVVVGVGRGATQGIVFRNAEALEAIARVEIVAFDKTGTLTLGRPRLTSVFVAAPAAGESSVEEHDVLRLAASVEAKSEHPLAEAVVGAARARELKPLGVIGFKAVPGRGVKALVRARPVIVGSLAFLEEEGVNTVSLITAAAVADARGAGVLAVAHEGRALGLLTVEDTLREDAPATVQRLRSLGLRPVILTGDRPGPARAVADATGIADVRAGLLPEEKEDAVEALRDGGIRVAMVGDGINDAPALARADVGIAMGTGTDVAIETAGVTLVRGELAAVGRAVEIGRRTFATIRWNLFWAFFYNVLAIPVAAGVLVPIAGIAITPTWGAGAMALSSVMVVTNSLRLRRA